MISEVVVNYGLKRVIVADDSLVSCRNGAWSMAGTFSPGINRIGSISGCFHKVYTGGVSRAGTGRVAFNLPVGTTSLRGSPNVNHSGTPSEVR